MKETYVGFKNKLKFFSDAKKNYKSLREHLDKQPVGFPASPSGIELRLLRETFTVDEADAALNLNYKSESFDTVYARAKEKGYEEDIFKQLLESMEKKGSIFVKYKNNEELYSLHPFAIGIFEMQISRLTPSYFLDSHYYMLQRFAIEYLTTEVPQMRVIPIEKSVPVSQNIATYDQIRGIVDQTKDRIMIANCICKVGKDLIGDPCKVTDRRETCMFFRDFSDTYIRNGWGRAVAKEEAMEILDQNEKDGLVLISSTMQEPQFVCSCCDCCCGVLEIIKLVSRPVDFAASNYMAELNNEECEGCKNCVNRCQMEAIKFDKKAKKAVAVDSKRCIGCGLCVPNCNTGSIKLRLNNNFVPPIDHDALYETIMQNKKSTLGKMTKMTKAMVGMKM